MANADGPASAEMYFICANFVWFQGGAALLLSRKTTLLWKTRI